MGVGVGGGIGVSKMLKVFTLKVFYVMDKGLSGKLSCSATGLVCSNSKFCLKILQ